MHGASSSGNQARLAPDGRRTGNLFRADRLPLSLAPDELLMTELEDLALALSATRELLVAASQSEPPATALVSKFLARSCDELIQRARNVAKGEHSGPKAELVELMTDIEEVCLAAVMLCGLR